jgi:hypothetical protein
MDLKISREISREISRICRETRFAHGRHQAVIRVFLAAALLAPAFLCGGCYMTPEDKAFYGRGWINPDELDVEQPPPRAFSDPTSIQPHMMGPGEY